MGEGRSSLSLCHAQTQLPDTGRAWPAANDRPHGFYGAHCDAHRESAQHVTEQRSAVAGESR